MVLPTTIYVHVEIHDHTDFHIYTTGQIGDTQWNRLTTDQYTYTMGIPESFFDCTLFGQLYKTDSPYPIPILHVRGSHFTIQHITIRHRYVEIAQYNNMNLTRRMFLDLPIVHINDIRCRGDVLSYTDT